MRRQEDDQPGLLPRATWLSRGRIFHETHGSLFEKSLPRHKTGVSWPLSPTTVSKRHWVWSDAAGGG